MVAGLTEAPKSWKYLVEKLFDHAAKHNEHRMDRELGGMRDGGGALPGQLIHCSIPNCIDKFTCPVSMYCYIGIIWVYLRVDDVIQNAARPTPRFYIHV